MASSWTSAEVDTLGSNIGTRMLGFEGITDQDEIQNRTVQMLARALNTGRVIGFVGSGIPQALGYPSWGKMALGVVKKTLKDPALESEGARRRLFEHLKELLDKERGDGAAAVQALGTCSEFYEREHDRDRFLSLVAESLRPPTKKNQKKNPLEVVIKELGIKRFLTTNYDDEIENALESTLGQKVVRLWEQRKRDEHGPPWPSSGQANRRGYQELGDTPSLIGRSAPKALTVNRKDPDALALFAVGAPGYEQGVFHCHGVMHSDQWHGMIVTERDYQRMYLKDDRETEAYRESLELAFSANAVLFMGVGMDEADLLRGLRHYVSEHSAPVERDLFALMRYEADDSEEKKEMLRKRLYVTYGVKVIFYGPAPRDNQEETNDRFCELIEQLADYQRKWWISWQMQPQARAPDWISVDASGAVRNPMIHSGSVTSGVEDALARDIKKGSGKLWMIVGPSGSGKGAVAEALVHSRNATPSVRELRDFYKKRFFASFHFTTEYLSVIEGAANHLLGGPEVDAGLPPEERLLKALKQERHLLVLSGVERLLVAREYPAVHGGEPLVAPPSSAGHDGLTPGDAAVIDESKVAINVEGIAPIQIGRPLTTSVRDFLRALCEAAAAGKSSVILTTSMWPDIVTKVPRRWNPVARPSSHPPRPGLESLSEEEARAAATEAPSSGARWTSIPPTEDTVGVYELQRGEGFVQSGARPPSKWEDLLTHALRGHAYALGLARELCPTSADPADQEDWLRNTYSEVTARAYHRRAEAVVAKALAKLRDERDERRLLDLPVLVRVAVFTTPVSVDAIQRTFDEKQRSGVVEALERLAARRLVEKVVPPSSARGSLYDCPQEEALYTAHPLVRQHLVPPGDTQRFALFGFDEQGDAVTTSTPALEREVTTWAQHLLDEAEERIKNGEDIRAVTRAAFALMRSRWNAIGIARQAHVDYDEHSERQPHYHRYFVLLARLLNLLNRHSLKKRWLYFRGIRRSDIESGEGVLYVDEMAWLFNELGLVCLQQGVLHDAYSLFRAGRQFNAIAERGALGRRFCQSIATLGFVQIERGQLGVAKGHLQQAFVLATERRDEEMVARVKGLLGWVAHLAGDTEAADGLYSDALRTLRRRGDNYRGMSILYRLRGDLERYRENYDACNADHRQSLSAAELGNHPDLAHHARISMVSAARSQAPKGKRVEPWADATLRAATDYAIRMGLPRLQVEVIGMMARLALDDGDVQTAGRLGRRVLAIATENGMGLRLTAGLVLMGDIAGERGERASAERVYRSAMDLGRRQGYYMQVERAQRKLFHMTS